MDLSHAALPPTADPIGFIGLGRLGLPVATNLLESGHPLTVWNRTAAKADPLVAAGAARAADPVGAVTLGGVLVTLLWDDASVEAIVRGDGLLDKLGCGLHISMSTLSPEGSRALAALHAAHGSSFVEAPIFGGHEAACARQLWVPVSGPAAAVARAKPLIVAMGAQGIYDFGEAAGAATAVKVAGNFLILSASASLREAFGFAQAQGVAPQALLDMMTGTLFPAPIYAFHGKLAVEGSDRLAQSAVPAKDLGLFEAGLEAGAAVDLVRAVRASLVGAEQSCGDISPSTA